MVGAVQCAGLLGSAAMDSRHRYMATVVEDSFGVPSGMVDAVVGDHLELLNNFLSMSGPRTVYFTYQPELRESVGGELVPYGGKVLKIGDRLPALVDEAAKTLYFIRVSKDDVGTKAPEQDICSGEVNAEGLECFQSTLQVRLQPTHCLTRLCPQLKRPHRRH